MSSPPELAKFQFYVGPSRRNPEQYRIRVVAPDGQEALQSVTIRQPRKKHLIHVSAGAGPSSPIKEIERGKVGLLVREKLSANPVPCRFDVYLPPDPIAALPW